MSVYILPVNKSCVSVAAFPRNRSGRVQLGQPHHTCDELHVGSCGLAPLFGRSFCVLWLLLELQNGA